MGATHSLARWGALRLSRRLARFVPLVGTMVALATLGAAVKRKGFVGGTVDTGLNAIPFVGGMKLAYEWVRGREVIEDLPHAGRPAR
jgi:hypothetical protein